MLFGIKCPHCEHRLNNIEFHPTTSVSSTGVELRTVCFACPSCEKLLGIQLDPIALRTETINGVVNALQKQRKP